MTNFLKDFIFVPVFFLAFFVLLEAKRRELEPSAAGRAVLRLGVGLWTRCELRREECRGGSGAETLEIVRHRDAGGLLRMSLLPVEDPSPALPSTGG